jgi:hypothetical protein
MQAASIPAQSSNRSAAAENAVIVAQMTPFYD